MLKRMRALALQMATPLILRRFRSYCDSNLYKFAMRLKILKGKIPDVMFFINLTDLAENKVFLNEQRLVIMKGSRSETYRSSSGKTPILKLYQFRPS